MQVAICPSPSYPEAAGRSENDINLRRDEEYYIVDVIFLVEGTLFKVPRAPFERNSGFFKNMFRRHLPLGIVPDGLSDEQPLRLDGIKKKEFRLLLNVLVPRFLQPTKPMSWREWFSVLDLSTMWLMNEAKDLAIKGITSLSLDTSEWVEVLKLSTSRTASEIRDKAIQELTPPEHLSPTDRILLARECQVVDWLLVGYKQLVQRNEIISADEEEQLGVNATLNVLRIKLIQESRRKGLSIFKSPDIAELEAIIRAAFEAEFDAAQYEL